MQLMKRIMVALACLVLGLQAGLVTSFAAGDASSKSSSQASQSNDIGFSVAAKIPSNQLDQHQSYFDLKMTPGRQQKIQTTIYNVTNAEIKVQTAIHTAYTNGNGIIEYVTPAKSFDPSLKYRMSQLTTIDGPKTVTIPANGSKVVTATIKMPKAAFNGVVLGGWYFKRVSNKVTGHVKGSMNIANQYSYVIGLKYTMGKLPAPQLKLDTVTAGMQNYRRGIFPQLRNVSAVIVPKLTLKAKLTSKNSGKVVKTFSQKDVQLAPNSVYKVPILTGTNRLQAGTYHVHLVAQNQDHRWVFDKDFVISTAAADKYNQASVDNSGINVGWFILFGALGMLIVGLIGVLIFLKIRKRRRA
ncbi:MULTISPECIES: DUF916 and DUF3324 domain-containing protein [Lactiplantibacillus]|uniref:Cell surface protein n=1 Tax=Lactiplantibacillus pentosus TaxID=1589 RepID=A0ABD7IR21_LACPE|nr:MULTISPECIES: DUF916 and DUF3324 domain-containing protein [Lactiplantibacillus]MCM8608879.1 DUF916 and DUF3324 domain-containing protein [Lactiplantibacillus sp. B652]MDC6397365.1 DUF916 and DUF3324 domain-containing protein [Lactiplantibacillus pentosus]PRO93890.1 cell surface protein [Lactiplantibacillus pentosus]RMW46483.1 DUF916 and DUF3324 domain-containing protein [Lactiplantibacillus pentosus]